MSGDPIASENYLQHAEHYLRIIAASQTQQQAQGQPCAADSEAEAPQEARDSGAPRSRSRGRPNGAGRNRDNAEAPAQESEQNAIVAGETEASEEAANVSPSADAGDVVNGAEPVVGDDAAVVEAVADEPVADTAEEQTTEAS